MQIEFLLNKEPYRIIEIPFTCVDFKKKENMQHELVIPNNISDIIFELIDPSIKNGE